MVCACNALSRSHAAGPFTEEYSSTTNPRSAFQELSQ
jgi:hypothetical protein